MTEETHLLNKPNSACTYSHKLLPTDKYPSQQEFSSTRIDEPDGWKRISCLYLMDVGPQGNADNSLSLPFFWPKALVIVKMVLANGWNQASQRSRWSTSPSCLRPFERTGATINIESFGKVWGWLSAKIDQNRFVSRKETGDLKINIK